MTSSHVNFILTSVWLILRVLSKQWLQKVDMPLWLPSFATRCFPLCCKIWRLPCEPNDSLEKLGRHFQLGMSKPPRLSGQQQCAFSICSVAAVIIRSSLWTFSQQSGFGCQNTNIKPVYSLITPSFFHITVHYWILRCHLPHGQVNRSHRNTHGLLQSLLWLDESLFSFH